MTTLLVVPNQIYFSCIAGSFISVTMGNCVDHVLGITYNKANNENKSLRDIWWENNTVIMFYEELVTSINQLV